MIRHFGLALVIAGGCSVLDADEPVKKEPTALKVGGELPFLVADFVAGPHRGHCGCPSVMIGNHAARGLVIWARTADAAVVELAAAVDSKGIDGEKTHGYLIAFDTPQGTLETQVKKGDFKGVTVGKSRHASAEEFKKWNLDARTAYVVFLVDRKQVKQIWTLSADDLTKKMSDAIVKEATTFLVSPKK